LFRENSFFSLPKSYGSLTDDYVDEIDSMLTTRNETENEASRRIKTEFLVQFDGIGKTDSKERILFIGATNRPQELDDAARRRMVKRLYIPLPDFKARRVLIEHLLRGESHTLGHAEFNRIARLSEGYSGADVSALCAEAAHVPVRGQDLSRIATIRPISLEDFDVALRHIRASVSKADLKSYEDWNQLYGSFQIPNTLEEPMEDDRLSNNSLQPEIIHEEQQSEECSRNIGIDRCNVPSIQSGESS